jgi:hypothetical protein
VSIRTINEVTGEIVLRRIPLRKKTRPEDEAKEGENDKVIFLLLFCSSITSKIQSHFSFHLFSTFSSPKKYEQPLPRERSKMVSAREKKESTDTRPPADSLVHKEVKEEGESQADEDDGQAVDAKPQMITSDEQEVEGLDEAEVGAVLGGKKNVVHFYFIFCSFFFGNKFFFCSL